MVNVLRLLFALVLVAACGSQSSQDERVRRAPPVSGQGDRAATDAASRAAAQPAATIASAHDGADAARCERDEDCELTAYQAGCCVQACESYAISKRVLAAARAKEDCAGRSGEACPPPAPCPPPTHRVLAARCDAGECVAVREPLPD